jgi:hypothetical protein
LVSATLTARGYPERHVAAEIIARLMMPDKWRELGLKSRAQADELAVLSTRLLKEHNGDAANEVIRAIAQNYPAAKASLTYRDSGRPARRSDSIDSTSALRPGDTGPDLTNAKRSGKSAARTNEEISDDERQNSLFGSSAEPVAVEQIEQAVSDYKDTLEKERLTAQLNAPLTRDEQLKSLKRSKEKKQTDLFAENEEPAQGSFTLGSGLGAMQPCRAVPTDARSSSR